jgi:hypothetical protein
MTVSTPPPTKESCKHDGWRTFTNPRFKNQGQCVRFFNHQQHDNRQHHQGNDNNQGNHNHDD